MKQTTEGLAMQKNLSKTIVTSVLFAFAATSALAVTNVDTAEGGFSFFQTESGETLEITTHRVAAGDQMVGSITHNGVIYNVFQQTDTGGPVYAIRQ
jgi:hypothetical protein